MLLAAGAAGAETVVLEAVERGTFRESGSYELGAEAAYATGRGSGGEARSFFVFDASALVGAATSATLRLWSPADGFVDADPVERIAVYAVSADAAALAWKPWVPPVTFEPRPSNGSFWDLGTGKQLGMARIAAGSAGFVEVPLDSALLRVLDRADGLVALGVRAVTLRKRPPQQVFANTGPGSGVPRPQLVIEIDPATAPVLATSLHVDGRRGRPRGTGSADDPFRSLAVALDLATPGDTVFVAPGRYAETLILKHGVDVRGAGADRTVLDLGSELPSLRCANATLDGMFVWRDEPPSVRDPREAVDCTNGTSPTLSNSRIGAARLALRLEGSQAVLRGSEIAGTIAGLDSSPVVVESQLEGKGESALSLSYSVAGAAPFRIERNRISGAVTLDGVAPQGSAIVGNLFLPSRRPVIPLQSSSGISASAFGDLGLIASNTFFRTQGISFCEPAGPIPPFSGPLPGPGRGTLPCADREQGATAVIANNILAFGRLGILVDPASDPVIVHNDVFQNDDPFGLGPTGNYVGLPDLTGVDGNLSEDPLFGGSGYEDALPGAGSAVLDAGADEHAATYSDLDGDPRIAAEAIDLGAQERQPGEMPARLMQVAAEGSERTDALGLGGFLAPRQSFRVSIRSDAQLDAPAAVDVESLALEGFAPPRRVASRCRSRDVDEDGDADLLCRFPFEALEGLQGLVTKRFCLVGESADGSPLRGCGRANVLFLPHATVR